MADRKPFGDRGLATYGDPIRDTYRVQTRGAEGSTVFVQDSSAAMYDACWLVMEGTAHVGEKARICEYSPGVWFHGKWLPPTRTVQGKVSAHLNVEKAKQVIEALTAWVERVEATVEGAAE